MAASTSASASSEYSQGPSLAGKGGLMLALAALFLITLITPEGFTPPRALASGGFCLDGASFPGVPSVLLIWLNLSAVSLLGLYQIIFTKHFNFLPSQNLSYVSTFIFCTACLPWAVYRLSTACLIALLILLSCNILFAVYGRRNASDSIFALFSLLSWGSMVEFGALYLVPVFFVGAIICKAMRFREFMAMLLGLAVPYWILIAFGAISLSELRLPEIIPVPLGDMAAGGLSGAWFFFELLAAALFYIFLLLINALRRTATSAQTRARFQLLNLVGCSLIVLMMLDYYNVQAYCVAFMMMLGYQVGYRTTGIAAPGRNIFIGLIFLVAIALFTTFQLLPA